jgi:hypothetical protein
MCWDLLALREIVGQAVRTEDSGTSAEQSRPPVVLNFRAFPATIRPAFQCRQGRPTRSTEQGIAGPVQCTRRSQTQRQEDRC